MTDTTPHTDLPREVWLNWQEAFHAKTRAKTVEAELPALDDKITQAKAHLEFLCGQHADKGREITALYKTSKIHRELVELWCSKHGHDLPDEPAELALTETRELPPEQVGAALNGNTPTAAAPPPATPCYANPPQHGDCGSPICTCPHHAAENDALTGEQERVHNILGTGPIGIPVAGHTTQLTRPDPSQQNTNGGGEAPGNGRFPGDGHE